MDRVVTGKIKNVVLNGGLDLVGFAPTERWENAPYLISPEAILPDSKTVVVAGIHITDTWTEMGGEPDPQTLGPGGWMDQNSLLDRVAYKVVRELKKYGYKAIAIASSNIWRYRKFEGVDSLFAPDLSHMHAAVAAGLAEIGWSGLAITPEFGPRVRFISIVTDAVLEPTPMYSGPKLCDMCMECVKACPSYAMVKDFDGKPHQVVIGGHTYKYANKNIWRCAWAEHFNLNLKSPTLLQDHIDEDTITAEIESRGVIGHERGVCQKVCIPPHLRSEKPSFGRSDKQITLNRINRRYPENMPTLKKVRDDVIAKATELGIDVAGIAPFDVHSKAGSVINIQAPGMKTVVAFAYSIPKEAADVWKYNSYVQNPYQYALRLKMHHITLKLSRMIEDYGYHAASFCSEIPNSKQNLKAEIEKNQYAFDKHDNNINFMAYELAQMAGIGRIGEQFINDEFGSHVVVGAVVTNAVLEELPTGTLTAPALLKTPKNLKGALESLARDHLASLFGVASADVFERMAKDVKMNIDESVLGKGIVDKKGDDGHDWYHGLWRSEIIDEEVKIATPKDYMKDAKSVIVIGMDYPKELMENSGLEATRQIGTYGYFNYQTTYELRFAAMEMANYLDRMGYKTLVTENLLGIGSKMDTPRELMPDFRCGALEGVAAGLGEIGKSGGLLTPEFGSDQRVITIITNAELAPDALYNGDTICTGCGNCQTKCPMIAHSGGSFKVHIADSVIDYPVISRNRCDWAKRYSLHRDEGPALIGNTTHVVPDHAGEVTIEEMAVACEKKDNIMKHRTVILEPCIKHCRSRENR